MSGAGCMDAGARRDGRGRGFGGGRWGERREFAVTPRGEEVFDAGEELAQREPDQERFGHSSAGVPHTGDEGLEVARYDVGLLDFNH